MSLSVLNICLYKLDSFIVFRILQAVLNYGCIYPLEKDHTTYRAYAYREIIPALKIASECLKDTEINNTIEEIKKLQVEEKLVKKTTYCKVTVDEFFTLLNTNFTGGKRNSSRSKSKSFSGPALSLPSSKQLTFSKVKIIYNNRKYSVYKLGRKNFIRSKGNVIFLSEIKGKYTKIDII